MLRPFNLIDLHDLLDDLFHFYCEIKPHDLLREFFRLYCIGLFIGCLMAIAIGLYYTPQFLIQFLEKELDRH